MRIPAVSVHVLHVHESGQPINFVRASHRCSRRTRVKSGALWIIADAVAPYKIL